MRVEVDWLIGRLALGLSVCFIATAAITFAAIGVPKVRTLIGRHTASGQTPYAAGEQIEMDPSIYSGTKAAVIAFVRSSCPGCQLAKPAFRRIASTVRGAGDLRMRIVTPIDSEAERRFVDELGLDGSELWTLASRTGRIRVVPTVVIVNGLGTVLYVCEGVPTAANESVILRFLNSAALR